MAYRTRATSRPRSRGPYALFRYRSSARRVILPGGRSGPPVGHPGVIRVRVLVFTVDEVREVRGGGLIGDACVDVWHDVRPGEAFCGIAYADLTDGTYSLDTATRTLTRAD